MNKQFENVMLRSAAFEKEEERNLQPLKTVFVITASKKHAEEKSQEVKTLSLME